MNEIWKDIKGYEGLYQISTFGNVKSMPNEFNRKEKILKQAILKNGYAQICLYKNKVKKLKKIHRLVGESFIPNPKNKPQINHKNSNRVDNNVNNLEWVTSSENNSHAIYKGKNKIANGTLIDDNTVENIRKDKKKGYKYKDLIIKYGRTIGALNQICNYKTHIYKIND